MSKTDPKRPVYKVIRNFVGNDEQKALQVVFEKYSQAPRNLEAFHTEKVFVWKPKIY